MDRLAGSIRTQLGGEGKGEVMEEKRWSGEKDGEGERLKGEQGMLGRSQTTIHIAGHWDQPHPSP